MAADVALTLEAKKQLKDLKNVVIATRLYDLIDRLKDWPDVSGAKPLRGKLAGKYRMRTGDYRLQFRVETKPGEPAEAKAGAEKEKNQAAVRQKIVVEKVGHRDRFYEN